MSKHRRAVGIHKLKGAQSRGSGKKGIRPGELKSNVRCLTNQFEHVRLVSLASWREANEVFLWDRGGPYLVTQEGCDPEDLMMTRDEFVLSRCGQWLSLGIFFRMSVAERWQKFVFSTAGEALRLMRNLPVKPVMWQRALNLFEEIASSETDAMAAAYQSGKRDACRAVR